MCGFTGFISDLKHDSDIIQNMTMALKHRGPDHQAWKSIKLSTAYIELGHTRLSILDLDPRSNQPYTYENLSLLYNGEIYNFKEVKKELKDKGISFETQGDTEVAIKAIFHLGIKEALSRFRGMFAMALLDEKDKKLSLIRDRIGVKPLYYYWKDRNFLFSSEIKSFSSFPNFEKKISAKALHSYFKYGFVRGEQSIFENCYRLNPGEILTYDIESNLISKKKYWSLKSCFEQKTTTLTEDEARLKLAGILRESFNLRMVADVPVGVFLSSGYDSTCVASFLAKEYRDLNTFTIGFNDPQQNEAQYAKEIAERLNTNHHELYCDNEQALTVLKDLFEIYDEPFGDSSGIPTVLVSRFAKEKVKVSLSADGGDELFFGYARYFSLLKIKNNLLLNNPITIFLITLITPFLSVIERTFKIYNLKTRATKLLQILKSKNFYEILDKTIMIFPEKEVNSLLNINCIDSHDTPELGIKGMQYWDSENYLPDDILVKVDRATMSASLEGREPFLDHKIFEFAGTFPINYLYKNGSGKSIIKDIVHEILPKELMNRPKKGFSVPLKDWLLGPIKGEVDSLINDEEIKKHSELNINEAINIKDAFYKNPSKVSPQKLWLIYSYLKWKKRWC